MTDRIEVSVADLAAALERFHLDVRPGTPHWLRGEQAKTVNGEIANADEVARALHRTLSAYAAHREPEPEPEPPVVTHAYEYGDGELRVIEAVLGALAGLPKDAEERVMSYVAWRSGYLIYPDVD